MQGHLVLLGLLWSSMISIELIANESLEGAPHFRLGIFSANKSRGNLLVEAQHRGIFAFNFNSESRLHQAPPRVFGKAWTFQDGSWVKLKDVTLPDVTYDYSFYTDKSQKRKDRAEAYWKFLEQMNIPTINPPVCMEAANNKQTFAKVMAKHRVSHPKSLKYTTDNLEKLLKQFSVVYLKPRRGNKGSGIIIVRRGPSATFSLSYRLNSPPLGWHTVHRKQLAWDQLQAEIDEAKGILNKSDKTYVAQQGIPTYRYMKKTTDVRITVQRNRQGSLEVTGRIARIGGNLAQGGKLEAFDTFIKQVATTLEMNPIELSDQFDKVASGTFLALEAQCQKVIGELGMDLLITPKGRVLVVEANDKPGYLKFRGNGRSDNPDSLFMSESARRAAVDMDDVRNRVLVDYATYLVQGPSI